MEPSSVWALIHVASCTLLLQKMLSCSTTTAQQAIGSSKPPKSNLSHKQWMALTNLSRDHSVVILPAEKGNATMLMGRSVYKKKLKNTVDDKSTYKKLCQDPTTRVERSVADAVKELYGKGLIADKLKDLHVRNPSYSNPPQMNDLPKIHKDGSLTYRLAKELAHVFAPLSGHTSSFVKNSTNFVHQVCELSLD